MALRRPNLLVTFGVLSLVPVIALAFALSISLRSSIRERAVENAKENAVFLANVGLPGYLSKQELEHGIAPAKRALIRTAITNGIVGEHLDGLVLRNARGGVVFASTAVQERAVLARAADFRRALAGDAAAHKIRVGDRDELEVTVPITFPFDTSASGVLYAWLPYEAIAEQVRRDTHRLLLILLGGLGSLYALLFPIVLRASNELRRRAAENERLALHDQLTGLPNRTLFGERTQAALDADPVAASPIALMVVDLDDFKRINDSHGHHVGDLLLQAAAQRLGHCVRAGDTVARLGGDEFGVLLARPESPSSIEHTAQRIITALQAPYELEGLTVTSTASVGIALADERSRDLETLLREADLAMYAAKQAGGGRHRPGRHLQPPQRAHEQLAS